jgi:hypothetical protein
MSKNSIVTFEDGDFKGRAEAFEKYSEAIESYDGIARAHHRSFLDVEPNRSVKTHFGKNDYYAFRPNEEVPRKSKSIIKMSMDAYDKVGIIRNIIDLMGDFGSQGINIVHENKSAEKFIRQWFKKVSGKERSERFLNNLYRTGHCFVYKSYANITPEIKKYIKSLANKEEDIILDIPTIQNGLVPWRYNFFNPLSIEMKDAQTNLFIGQNAFQISTHTFFDQYKDETMPSNVLETLPPDVRQAYQKQKRKITLDPDRLSVFFYKKDDWQQWAHPMVYAILDDIIMLEKMKLADMAALDGAISNIRLWTLGNFEYKVLPTKEGVNKLRNILASNTGGGTMELVYGPELKFTESNSQVHKFLGSEKYQAVLNSIYAGLGVPPTLTGMAGNGGGFTNNFISLKTMVERLQYGRDQLTKFWESELEYVRKSMGFAKPFYVVYDQMSLSDEAAEKNLLIQLADLDIISHETILERFKEVPTVEKVRLQREDKLRDKDKLPEKASPFHNANHEKDMEKITKQGEINTKIKDQQQKQKPPQPNGRPPQKQDTRPRKKRTETPRSTPGVADLIVWATSAFESTQHINKGYLEIKGKSNARQLTKDEAVELENIKLAAFLALEPMSDISDENLKKALASNNVIPNEFKYIRDNSPNMENYKKMVVGVYVEQFFNEN